MRVILVAVCAALVLAGCGDPLNDVPKLSEVPLPQDPAQVDALADPGDAADQPIAATTPVPAPRAAEAPRRGFLGFLRGRAEAAKADADAPVTEAALAPPVAQEDKPRRGLFARRDTPAGLGRGRGAAPQPGAPDYRQVDLGTTLPYGELARVCGVTAKQLGTKIGQYPETGRGYVLYDSQPGSGNARTHYLTGFGDGCARQFTAAFVIFAAPDAYETIRFGPAGKTVPKKRTDDAYVTLKNRVCRVASEEPCGARISRLQDNTLFVSVYERFGSNPVWKTVLVHDGAVLAADMSN